MKHLGDITKIHGDQIEPVDCITFGSPCQDLSIAGRRAGLAGERSGLFMEAVRIIKEMRSSTNGLCPIFAVWENVPGAFSSNGGEDFRTALEELARVEQPDASIPRPSGRERGGRWSKAGAIVGNGWSLAIEIQDIKKSCIPKSELNSYAEYAPELFAWHISDLKVYDVPRDLDEFSRFGFFGMGRSNCVCGNWRCENYEPSDSYMEPPTCKIEGCSIYRPPQSWFYVEELHE